MENKKLTKKDYYGMLKDIVLTSDVDNKEELEAFINRQIEARFKTKKRAGNELLID